MLRATFSTPGSSTPYAIAYAYRTAPPENALAILGGALDVLRGEFPDQGTLDLSRPVKFKPGDWVRVWLPDDPDPVYLGECMGEPWETGRGTLNLRGLWDTLRRSSWAGKAQGTFLPFFTAVLSQSDRPAWLTVGALPDLPSLFKADTPFELLGDTISAITPALDGHLIGVTAQAAVSCVDPGEAVTYRFPAPLSDRPPGSTDNYANAVRFQYAYPSGDPGFFHGLNNAEITRVGGRRWAVEQVTAREIGLPAEPFEAVQGKVTQTVRPNGVAEYQQDLVLTGEVLHTVNLSDAEVADLTEPAAMTAYGTAEEQARADRVTRADLTFWANIWETLKQVLGSQPGYAPEEFRTHQTLQDNANLYVNARVTTLPGWNLLQTLRIGTVGADGTVTWFTRPNSDVSSRFNALFHPEGVWNPVPNPQNTPELQNVYELMIVTNYVNENTQGKDQRFAIGYDPAFLAAADAANVPVLPLSLRGGGGLYYVDNSTPKRLSFPGNLDRTLVTQWVVNGTVEELRTLRFPVLTAGFTPADSAFIRGSGTDTWYGVALVELNTPLTLPYGSSVEVELMPGGAVTACWALHALDLAAGQTEAARLGTGLPVGVMTAASKAQPTPYTVLTRNGETGDGWARFAVRHADSWNGLGDPPGPMTVVALLLQGVSAVGRLRVRTPQLDGLSGYAARLLRHRAAPMRDWTGLVRSLKRCPALGVAAFEVPGSPDEVLDVQRVTYDLKLNVVSVRAGSPLPADDADAIGTQVEKVYRVIRRAGGTE